jgi:hypothetical protein
MTSVPEEYDVYLSCPMGALQAEHRYQEIRLQAMTVVETFEKECNFKVFFFGREVDSRGRLDESDLPVAKVVRCTNALRRSRYYALLLPARLSSGALAEAGFALALNKKGIYFVKSREHLPFLLRYSESAFPIRIHQYKTIDGLVNVIKTHREQLFDLAAVNPGSQPGSPPLSDSGPLRQLDAQAIVQDRLRDLRRVLVDVSDEIQSLEHLLQVDVPSSLNKIRFITEKLLHKLSIRHNTRWGEAEPTLERMLGPLVSQRVVPKHIAVHVRTIQMNASPGSHYQEFALTRTHAIIAQQALIEFLEWYSQSPVEG